MSTFPEDPPIVGPVAEIARAMSDDELRKAQDAYAAGDADAGDRPQG